MPATSVPAPVVLNAPRTVVLRTGVSAATQSVALNPSSPLATSAVPASAAPGDLEMAAAQAKLDALSDAMRKRDWDAAEKALPAAAGVLPPQEGKELRESIEAQIGLARGDPTKFYAQLKRVAEEEFDDAEAMNEIAWRLLTTKAFEGKRNLTLAEKCAVQAVALTKEGHSDKLDTLARLRWLQGKKEEAIRWQIKAVDKADEPRMKALLQKTLDALLKGTLPPADDEEEDSAR